MPLGIPLLALLVAQTPTPAAGAVGADDGVSRAAAAAERAAAAAQTAAEAAAKAAEAAARVVDSVKPAAPPASPSPAAAAAPSAASWAGTVGANLIWLTGNANTLTLSANANVTKTFEGGWSTTGKAYANYGQSEGTGQTSNTITALAAGGQLRADKVLVPETSVYILGGLDSDHIASLEIREYAEAGAGIFWVDEKQGDFQKLLLRTDVGMRYAVDNRWEYFTATPPAAGDPGLGRLPQLTFLGPHFGLSFRYALSKDIIFTEEAGLSENIDGADRTLATTVTKLASRLFKSLSFAVAFQAAYDSMPAPTKVNTDTGLTIGLEASF